MINSKKGGSMVFIGSMSGSIVSLNAFSDKFFLQKILIHAIIRSTILRFEFRNMHLRLIVILPNILASMCIQRFQSCEFCFGLYRVSLIF